MCIRDSRAANKTSMWYHTIRNVVLVVFWGTPLRPTAGAVVLIPKGTTLQNVPWLCASIEESYAISSWSSTATLSLKFELWFQRLDLIFSVLYELYLSNIFTAIRARTSTSHGSFFVFRVRAANKQACGTI